MKTTKFLPHLLVAGATMFGTACSSTSSTGTGASTGGSTVTGSVSETTNPNTSASDAGTAGTSGTSGATGSGSMSGTGTIGSGSVSGSATGTNAAADQSAFMATFATMDDPTFMLTAASSNMLELQLSQTALQQATNTDVKKYAQMMVDHHTKSAQQWKTVAQPLGISMPTTLMPVHQALVDKVSKHPSGKQFDEAYMDAMETAHKMDVALFDIKAKQAQTPSVKSFASQSLPMLRSHHTMADQIEQKVK